MIKPGKEILVGNGKRFRVLDVVPFDGEDESPFVGLLQVEQVTSTFGRTTRGLRGSARPQLPEDPLNRLTEVPRVRSDSTAAGGGREIAHAEITNGGVVMRFFMRTFGVALIAACVVGASTASAAKTTTTTVKWFGGAATSCGADETATVPAGDVRVTFGWGTYSNYYTTQFLNIQYVTYSVGGVTTNQAVGDQSNWKLTTGKDMTGAKVYVAQYTSPVLATLASGESVTVTFSLKTTDTAYDNDTTSYPAGTELLGAHTSCTITAS
jgi:hypothetical protein